MIGITIEQMDLIKQLPNKSDKLIGFALIYLSCLYADSEGEFDCKEFTLNHLTQISLKQIERVINKLLELGYLDCVYRNRLKPVSYENRKYICSKYPNRYKLGLLKPVSDQFVYCYNKIDTKQENLQFYFWHCYSEYLSMCNLKPSRREKENIIKFQINVDNGIAV